MFLSFTASSDLFRLVAREQRYLMDYGREWALYIERTNQR